MAGNMLRASSSQNQAAAATSSKQPLHKRLDIGSEKGLDAKVLRRLAQNREAARKCRIRKKAYVQQLESSRIRLAQLEQDLQMARAQGLLLGGGGGAPANSSSGAAMFDMEYARWLEEEERQMGELRGALQSGLAEEELQGVVEAYVSHMDDMFRLKEVGARADVLHVYTGAWASPMERCFLWMGGFRPSDLIKMVISNIMSHQQSSEQHQLMGLYSLQQCSQQAEDALSQGLHQLHQSVVDTVAADSGMHYMGVALAKLSNLQGFVRQGDNLRQQTLHQLCRIFTLDQAARCFILIGEYYTRLRSLTHLSLSPSPPTQDPTPTMICAADQASTNLHIMMLHHQEESLINHFPTL